MSSRFSASEPSQILLRNRLDVTEGKLEIAMIDGQPRIRITRVADRDAVAYFTSIEDAFAWLESFPEDLDPEAHPDRWLVATNGLVLRKIVETPTLVIGIPLLGGHPTATAEQRDRYPAENIGRIEAYDRDGTPLGGLRVDKHKCYVDARYRDVTMTASLATALELLLFVDRSAESLSGHEAMAMVPTIERLRRAAPETTDHSISMFARLQNAILALAPMPEADPPEAGSKSSGFE